MDMLDGRRRADRGHLGRRRGHPAPARVDARHEAGDDRDAGPGPRGDARRSHGPDPRHRRERPGRDRRARAAAPIRRSGTTACSRASGVITLEAGADGTTTIVRWRETLVPPLLPELGARVQAPILTPGVPGRPPPPQAPGRDRRGGRLSAASDAWSPPRRRDVRAVPRALLAPAAGLGEDGQVLSGVSGLVEQLCYLLREQGGTHVGCATDRVIRSFRNDLYPGYKT